MVPSKRQTEKRPNCRNGKRSVVSMVGWYAGGWEEEGWTAAAQEIFCMILSWMHDTKHLSKTKWTSWTESKLMYTNLKTKCNVRGIAELSVECDKTI